MIGVARATCFNARICCLLLGAPLAMLLSACFDSTPTPTPTPEPVTQIGQRDERVIYSHDFSNGDGGWVFLTEAPTPESVPENALCVGTNCFVPVPTVDGAMQLKSPWFHDPNHAPPGAGFLSLLAFTYLRGFLGAPTADLSVIDLRTLRLVVQMKAENLDVKGGHLYFWFQTFMPDGKFVNYAYTIRPLNLAMRGDRFTRIELDLSPDPSYWTCLGSSEERVDTYGCAPIEDALSQFNLDFGFIILPVDPLPIPEAQPSGTILVKAIRIVAQTERREPGER